MTLSLGIVQPFSAISPNTPYHPNWVHEEMLSPFENMHRRGRKAVCVSAQELTGAVCNCFFKVALCRGWGITAPIQEGLPSFPKAPVLKCFHYKADQGPIPSSAPTLSALQEQQLSVMYRRQTARLPKWFAHHHRLNMHLIYILYIYTSKCINSLS